VYTNKVWLLGTNTCQEVNTDILSVRCMLSGVVCGPIICPDCAAVCTFTGSYLTFPTIGSRTVLLFRRLGSCLSPLWPGFKPPPDRVECLVEKCHWNSFSPVLQRSLTSVVPSVVLGPCSSSSVTDCCAVSLLGLSCFVMLAV